MTIEERAIEFANATIVKSTNFIVWNQVRLRYIEIATEQDRIARDEEREKACELYRKELMQVVRLMNISSKGSGELIDIDGSVNDFRKAMKGGNG